MFKFIKSFVNGDTGSDGEKITSNIIKHLDDNYLMLNDITIPKYDDANNQIGTSQIDHVIFDKKHGQIIVIETKNYAGIVRGDISGDVFTVDYNTPHTTWDNKKTFKVNNPVRQNYGHIKALQKLIENQTGNKVPLQAFTSYVMMVGENNIYITDGYKDKKVYPSTQHLFHKDVVSDDFADVINKIKNPTVNSKIDNKNMENIVDLISDINMTKNGFRNIIKTQINKWKHVNNLKVEIESKKKFKLS